MISFHSCVVTPPSDGDLDEGSFALDSIVVNNEPTTITHEPHDFVCQPLPAIPTNSVTCSMENSYNDSERFCGWAAVKAGTANVDVRVGIFEGLNAQTQEDAPYLIVEPLLQPAATATIQSAPMQKTSKGGTVTCWFRLVGGVGEVGYLEGTSTTFEKIADLNTNEAWEPFTYDVPVLVPGSAATLMVCLLVEKLFLGVYALRFEIMYFRCNSN